MSINRGMDKEDMVYTHPHTHTCTMEYYFAIKKSEIMMSFAATFVDLEIFIPSTSDRER